MKQLISSVRVTIVGVSPSADAVAGTKILQYMAFFIGLNVSPDRLSRLTSFTERPAAMFVRRCPSLFLSVVDEPKQVDAPASTGARFAFLLVNRQAFNPRSDLPNLNQPDLLTVVVNRVVPHSTARARLPSPLNAPRLGFEFMAFYVIFLSLPVFSEFVNLLPCRCFEPF
jgi:hypothetical protein